MSAVPDLQAHAPRLGFVGTGWIGRHRMSAIADAEAGIVSCVCEPSDEARDPVREQFDDCAVVDSVEELLDHDLDGVVIATPSALHAGQSIRALERGVPVFCQKPLGRNAEETRRVVDTARSADRLLGVDFSYRYAEAFIAAGELVQSGELGEVYGADLVFHNAYGPDKDWFYDRSLSGGGCLIDLGIHLVDFLLWTLQPSIIAGVGGRLLSGGAPLAPDAHDVEDYALGTFDADATAVRLACSWRLPAGRDAVIEASFYGTRGGVSVRNVNGSFYDFVTDHLVGTSSRRMVDPPDAWGGRAAVEWARRLRTSRGFDDGIQSVVRTAEVLDEIYAGGRAS